MRDPSLVGIAPPLVQRHEHAVRWVFAFALGVVVGAALAIALVISAEDDSSASAPAPAPDAQPVPPAQEVPGPAPVEPAAPTTSFADIEPPPPLRFVPEHDPSRPPKGRYVDPLEPLTLYELPGSPGRFRFEGISFRYPRRWELVSTGGYHGLTGNNLWLAAVGVSPRDHLLVMANYFPWRYSDRQMRGMARSVVRSVVQAEGGRVLRPPSPVGTAGVTVFWSDIVSTTPTGDSLTRIFLFAWNDVEYYLACKQNLKSAVAVLRGCDMVINSLQLGIYE